MVGVVVHKLPEKYTSSDIIGVTKGSDRPTVYFRDGSRYTQKHKNMNNIGYHPPVNHVFFANIKEVDYQNHLGSSAKRSAYRRKVARGLPVPNFAKPGALESARLFEVKTDAAGHVITHASRSKLQPALVSEKFSLISSIRRRSPVKELDGVNYQYK